MTPDPWVFGIFAVIVAIHLLVVVYASRQGRRVATDDGVDLAGSERVACPECGTENDPEYRFCRECITEIRGAGVGRGENYAAGSRRIP